MSTKHNFTVLDGLRGLAAIAVVTHHAPDTLGLRWLSGSSLSVDLFFALSGFVLSYAYGDRLAGPMRFWDFLRIRVIRLWPLYLAGSALGLLVVLASALFGKAETAAIDIAISAVLALFMLPTPRVWSTNHLYPFPFNLPAWSLFWEMVINLVFAAVMPRLDRRLLSIILVIGAGLLIATGIIAHGLEVGSNWNHFWGGGGRVVFSFFAGVAAFRIWRARPRILPVPAWAPMLALLAVMAFPAGADRTIFDLFATLIVFPALILVSAMIDPGGLKGLCAWLGRISYPLYVIHVPIIALAVVALPRLIGRDLAALGPAGTLGILLVSLVVAEVFEHADRRVRKVLTKRFATAS